MFLRRFHPHRGFDLRYTYVYYTHYSDDALAIRFLVTGIWILDTLRFLFVCHFLYYYLITNYGIPTSLLYMVWSLPASILVQVIMATAVRCFFVHQIFYLCRPEVRWWVTAPTGHGRCYQYWLGPGLALCQLLWSTPTRPIMFAGILISDNRFIDSETSLGPQISFYTGIPTLTVYVLAEILITVSLCTLFYDNGSRSTFPRLVTIAELAAEVNHQNAWTIAFDFIGQGSSLNARQYLRSQASSTVTDLRISAVDFAKLEGHVESSEDGTGRFRVWQEAHTDIAADPSLALILFATRLSGVSLNNPYALVSYYSPRGARDYETEGLAR
ncbi:hypothetical protein EDD17DRAFT_1899672 [Pisolithus thermaeus]|nr:hypothetical protein EDD17DRAFT_1899672 [Pisolithus thermaeus]